MDTKKEGQKLIIYLKGRLDLTASSQIEEEISRLIDDSNHHLILNLGGVDYMSSSGFRVCITSLRKLNARNGTLKMCCIQPNVYRIFEVIELKSIFDIYETEEEALKA